MTYINFNYLIILSLLYSYSCRSTEQDNILSGSGVAPVKINLLGSEYANSDKPAQVASINQKTLTTDNNAEHYSTLISPSSFISAELTANRSLSPVASSKNLNTVAAVPGDQLGAGMKFRVIAFRKDNGNYQAYQDYIVGQQAAPLMLDGGTTYNMVVYSYGSTTLPGINSSEQSNIGSAKIDYDNDNRDLMYQKISDFTPNGNSNNTLNIKLRHKIPNITVTLKSNLTNSISSISNALIGNNYPNAKFSINSGQIVDWGSSNKVSVNFPSGVSNSLTSLPVFVNNDTSNGLFSADVTVSGITKTIDLVNAFKITPEYKSNLTINLNSCGAYLGPGNTQWKEFMCHNLGADLSADPFTPSAAIHGAKYKWGAKTGEIGRYISQSDDQDQSNNGAIAGWTVPDLSGNLWNSGTDADPVKTDKDPCPSGYRVPTVFEWEKVIDFNSSTRIGSWENSPSNYSTAIKFGDRLLLPIPGYRVNSSGRLADRGESGRYFSNSNNVGVLAIEPGYIKVVREDARGHGFSVRCIAK
ncbi:hypothetical protein HZR00_17290 [Elizabethkingia anophelis]|nr:hypothetical protein [Elizabethkingia anophelis]